MASLPSNSIPEPAKIEQVVTEFFAKSLHIILESRSPYVSSRNYCTDLLTSSPSSSSSSSSGQPRDRWFNLALRDCPAALENFDLWRQSNLEPLVVDVVLISRRLKDEFLTEIKSEKIVERWVVRYENRSSSNSHREFYSSGKRSVGSSHSSEIPSMYKKMYKRTVILLRSLYATVRLLPAYKVFRDLNSSGRIFPFGLSHKISSYVEPFTQSEDAEMKLLSFVPVDTPCGRLSLTVSYRPILVDISSEPSTSISTQFIPDYVGSPTTDPLKRLRSLPSAGSLPTYASFTRRHSWSNNDQGVAPSVSLSPSPTYSDSRASHYSPSSHLPPRSQQLDQSPSTCPSSYNVSSLSHTKNTNFNEYWPSPPFSPSPSPSPPTNLPSTQLRNSIQRSESAPVSIPLPRLEKNRGLLNQGWPPSPPVKTGMAGCSSQSDLLRAQVTAASASQTTTPERKLQQEKGSSEFHIGMPQQKMLYSGKDEVGNLSGRKLSLCSSPRIASMSNSKITFLDDYDDSEFTCPFALEDEDLMGSCRIEPTDVDQNLVAGELVPIRRSPDAIVGAFVQMLKTAAPLRQDLPITFISSQSLKDEVLSPGIQYNKDKENGIEKFGTSSGSMITASRLFRSRTASDALEELRKYREMKEILLRQGGSK